MYPHLTQVQAKVDFLALSDTLHNKVSVKANDWGCIILQRCEQDMIARRRIKNSGDIVEAH